MIQNAQSDNEKASLVYQVEMLKDNIEDMEEACALLHVSKLWDFTVKTLFLVSICILVNSSFLFVIFRKNTKTSIENAKKQSENWWESNKSWIIIDTY